MAKLPGHEPAVITSELVTTGDASQLSVAVALPVPAIVLSSSQLIVTSAGQLIIGPVTSCTVIVWIQVDELLQLSVAVKVLVIVKLPGHEPAVITSELVTTGDASQLSVAVALPRAATELSS